MTEPLPGAPAWKTVPERGTPLMLNFVLGIARLAGRRLTHWMTLPPTVLYFLLTAGPARRASRQFLSRAQGAPASLWQVARHIHTFASVVLDRMLFVLGGFHDIVLEEHRDSAERQTTYTSSRGSLLFVSHLGSFEALRVVGVDRAPMKFLLDRRHSPLLTTKLGALRPELAASIIDTDQPGPALVLAVRQALDEGYRVGLMVDRPRAGERIVKVPFLGAPAPFPAGPWLLASALHARVVLGFCTFQGGNRYEGRFELFSEKLEIPRASREQALEDCVRRYAARLEEQARRAPYNWFNFYDFWNETAPH